VSTLRLLHVTTIGYTAEAFLLPLARRAQERGWSVDLAANMERSAQGKDVGEKARATFDAVHELTWTRSPLHLAAIVHSARELRRIVEAGGYDIVHLHTPIAAVAGRAALRHVRAALGTSVIYTAHGFHFYRGQSPLPNAVFKTAERTAGPWTDWLVTMNTEDRDAALQLALVPPDRLQYIPGIGVHTDFYSPSSATPDAIEQARASLGVAPGEQLITMIAELNRNKRPVEVIEAFARSGAAEHAHLVSLGYGDLREACEQVAARLGVRDRVHLLGYVPDVRPYVLGSAATVLYSAREGVPRSSLESLAMGVPVIASDIRGNRDLAATGGGWLAANSDELARALAEAVTDPAEAARRGALGRELVEREYAQEIVLGRYMDLYDRALAARPGR
jgi:glycosyltransferase involved in cell wall biosynthesis